MLFDFKYRKWSGCLSNVWLQGVPTSLEYPKCNVLKLRKVCERSELRLHNIDPIKGGIFEFWPNKKGWILNFDPIKMEILTLFIGSIFFKRSSLRSQTFLSFTTLHVAYSILGHPVLESVINWDKIKALQQNSVLNLNASE